MKKQLLIIDSDAFLAGIYARRFEESKWKVEVAETVKEARDILKKQIPEAILIDVETVEGALDFFKELRKETETQDTLLVVLTELGKKETIDEAYRAGADSYLLKGHFVPSEVCDKLTELLENRS